MNCELRSRGAETARSVGSFPSQLEEGACPPGFPTQGRGQPCSAQGGGGCGSPGPASPSGLGAHLPNSAGRTLQSGGCFSRPHLSSTGCLATAFVTQDPEPEPQGVGVEGSRCPAGGRQGWTQNHLLGTPARSRTQLSGVRVRIPSPPFLFLLSTSPYLCAFDLVSEDRHAVVRNLHKSPGTCS